MVLCVGACRCLVAVAAQVAVVAAVAAVWGPAGVAVHLVAAVVSQVRGRYRLLLPTRCTLCFP